MPNLFTGLVLCGACGGPVTYYTARPGGKCNRLVFSYLQCRGARIGAGCTSKERVAYEPVERAILDGLADVRTDAAPPGATAALETEREIAALTARLAFITRQVARFAEWRTRTSRRQCGRS